MDDALFIHRIHFAFTITYHYLFPAADDGARAADRRPEDARAAHRRPVYDNAARFWTQIFGINFVAGVVTGIPMEFQFGTNWARFSQLTGGVIAQPLAMEGVFSFFLESAFLGLFLFGEKRLGRAATGGRRSWCSSARGCRASSSSPRTPGCSTRSATSGCRRLVRGHSFWGVLRILGR